MRTSVPVLVLLLTTPAFAQGFTSPPGYLTTEGMSRGGGTINGYAYMLGAFADGRFQVVDGEADVMNAGAAPGDELADRRVRGLRLEQLDQGVTGLESGDSCPIGVVERYFGQPQEVPIEGQDLIERVHGDPDVRDGGSAAPRARSVVRHVTRLRPEGRVERNLQ